MPKEPLAECVERIDVLLAKVETLPDAAVREDVQEIVQCLLDYHGAALARLLQLLAGGRTNGSQRAVVERLAEDELVGSLLLLHGQHPADFETRVRAGLTHVRPFLESHGGNVELVEIDDGVVRLRLDGSCHGCPSSAATLKLRIEQAIYELAPETEAIEVVDGTAPVAEPKGFVGLEKLSIGQAGSA